MTDRGRKRFLSYSTFFDTRALLLNEEIHESWDEDVKSMHRSNKENIRTHLACEFGAYAMESKIKNFSDMGVLPFSIVAHHNAFFLQARNAFIIGSYHSSLCGVCALGERILNHLIDDLKAEFQSHEKFKKVAQRKSFDNWDFMIEALNSWDVLLPDVLQEFHELKMLRHSSIHFNKSTYDSTRDDALKAIKTMNTIVERQFGAMGRQPWMIEGTAGHCFIKKAFEDHPFVKHYILPRSPLAGVFFAIQFDDRMKPSFFDIDSYEPGEYSDSEFKEAYNNREHSKIAKTAQSMQVAVGRR